MVGVSTILKLGEELLADPEKHQDHAQKLLNLITDAKSSEAVVKACVRALLLLFEDFAERGVLTFSQKQGLGKNSHWVDETFAAFQPKLLQLLSGNSNLELQMCVLTAALDISKLGHAKAFYPKFFLLVFESLFCCKSVDFYNLFQFFEAGFMKYVDIRFYMYKALDYMAAASKNGDLASLVPHLRSSDLVDQSELILRLEHALNLATPICKRADPKPNTLPTTDTENEVDEVWCGIKINAFSSIKQVQKKKRLNDGKSASADKVPKWLTPHHQRMVYSSAWLNFIRLPLSKAVFLKILVNLHDKVLPNLSNPLQLADLLKSSLDAGGLLGIMSLHAIFVLVTKYGLEYPQFYVKLYQLIEPTALKAKYRAKFFSLADLFLASPLVPAYSVGSFIKRFARLALSASPAGSLICLVFIHNLLRRHPGCLVLINRAGDTTMETDPFCNDQSDPAKSNALDSSLWEVKTLTNHFYNQVSALALQILEKDLSDKKKTSEVDLSIVLHGSYTALIKSELNKRIKQIPTAFYAEKPTTLFSPNAFAGWATS